MNPKASFGNKFRSKLRGIIPSAARDCSTYQFRSAAHTELEFHNKRFFTEAFNIVFSDNSYLLNTERMQRIAAGEIPDDLLLFNVIPANFDPSLAPAGTQCVISLIFCPPDHGLEYSQAYRNKLDECMERASPGFLSHVESGEYYGS